MRNGWHPTGRETHGGRSKKTSLGKGVPQVLHPDIFQISGERAGAGKNPYG